MATLLLALLAHPPRGEKGTGEWDESLDLSHWHKCCTGRRCVSADQFRGDFLGGLPLWTEKRCQHECERKGGCAYVTWYPATGRAAHLEGGRNGEKRKLLKGTNMLKCVRHTDCNSVYEEEDAVVYAKSQAACPATCDATATPTLQRRTDGSTWAT